jgi:crotonobetainyl-CoA:carnitine CoA-transferase CaiB-like acyl-CoA transferase
MTPARALEGLKVLDMSRILAGPSATQMLGDLGADVVKVERPGRGDDTRGWGPPFHEPDDGEQRVAGYFLAANRSKRSIAIDFATDAGAELITRLAQKADVLVENLKPFDLDARGLGYAQLRAIHPGLIYCSISGFGRTGPRAHEPGYDFLAQAAGGLMSLTGEPEGAPVKLGVGISDLYTGMHAAIGILAALRHRDRTGEGQHIDLSLYDSTLAMLSNAAVDHFLTGAPPQRLGNAHPHIVPYGVFAASDGHLVIAVGNDAQFVRFVALLDGPPLASDPRFATNAGRVEHRVALNAILAPLLSSSPVDHWLEVLRHARIPTSKVQSVPEAFADPVAAARAMRITSGDHTLLGNPLKLSATPVDTSRPPPHLDAHRDEVLHEWLGLDTSARDALAARGAFGE